MKLFIKQKGMSIISLMIGLLISMIAILGSLSLYKNLTQISVDMTLDTRHNGDTSAALLRIQLELQEAGFGMPNPIPTGVSHLALINNQTIAWRAQPGQAVTSITCKRISETSSAGTDIVDGNKEAKVLNLQTLNYVAGGPCTDSSNLTAITDAQWAAGKKEILNVTVVSRLDERYRRTAANSAIFSFGVTSNQQCSPFGIAATMDATVISVSYITSQGLNAAPNSAINTINNNASISSASYNLCITNLVSA